jgi:dolichol-phosphate mannosyltransferase
MMFATVGAIVYVISVYLLGNPVEGYTTMMLFAAGAFFALFAVLSVVIKYLSVILGLVFNKQRYVVESIEKITG